MARTSAPGKTSAPHALADNLRREALPIPDRQYKGDLTYDARDPQTYFPPIEPLRPPEGAPNVLVVLLDDVGFGACSAFGGPCQTPTFEKSAVGGSKYTRFHTTGQRHGRCYSNQGCPAGHQAGQRRGAEGAGLR